ncbi:MAG: O-antigen ligase family protein [Bacteroidota bacterium]
MNPVRRLARFGQSLGLFWMMAALPLANWLMSVGIITLACTWVLYAIADGMDRNEPWARWYTYRHTPGALRFALIYGVFAVSLLWSDELGYGFKDLRTKLPVLVLPIIVCGLDPISRRTWSALWWTFIASLTFAVAVCLMVYFGVYNQWAVPLGFRPREVHNFRDISIFISHIRFSLLLVMGLATLYQFTPRRAGAVVLSSALAMLFLYFLWTIESMTASVLILALLVVLILRTALNRQRYLILLIMAGVTLASVTAGFFWVRNTYRAYYTAQPVDHRSLATHSASGEAYVHDTINLQVENGQLTMLYVAWSELADAWDERSGIPFEGDDALGNPVKGTIIRYMTSRGLRKDRIGVEALTSEDIRRIEAGIASAKLAEHSGLRRRLDRIMFEYHCFKLGSNPTGHSVFQRLEFWKAGREIIRQNFWWGVGMGDVKSAFSAEYVRANTPLDVSYRLRAHNQWMTVWITSGLVGFVTFILAWFTLFRRDSRSRSWLFLAFFVVASLSFLTEDTLESQAGVSFVAFLGSVLLFLPRKPAGIELRGPVK